MDQTNGGTLAHGHVGARCVSCHSEDAVVRFAPGVAQVHQIVRCTKCGLMYAHPMDAPETETARAEMDETARALHNQQRIEKERWQVGDYDKTRKTLNRQHPNRGRLLEIGSGYGFLLAQFRADGWDVAGVDPQAEACDFARRYHQLEIICGLFETSGLADASCDVIVMNHVIEHVPDPQELLRQIHRVLKPGGHLAMETPAYDTLMYAILGKRERSLSCDGHVFFFTRKTLQTLYEQAGFEKVSFVRVGRTLSVNRLMWVIGTISKSSALRRWLDAVSRKLRLNDLRIHLNFGDMQRVCVQKNRNASATMLNPQRRCGAGDALFLARDPAPQQPRAP
jgi:SAM-dependent methyltransferase